MRLNTLSLLGHEVFDATFKPFQNLDGHYLADKSQYPFFDILQHVKQPSAILNIALAGWNKKDISITCTQEPHKPNELIISADAGEPKESKYRHVQRGISIKKFKKAFTLSSGVEIDNVTFENGILSVSLHQETPIEKTKKTYKL